jgi:glycosyltransferase EpsH
MENYIDQNNLSGDFKKALNNRICYSLIGIGLTEFIKTNPKSTFQKIRFIKRVLNNAIYNTALKQLTLKYFPFHWKVFYLCAKVKFAIGIFVLLKVISKIIDR